MLTYREGKRPGSDARQFLRQEVRGGSFADSFLRLVMNNHVHQQRTVVDYQPVNRALAAKQQRRGYVAIAVTADRHSAAI